MEKEKRKSFKVLLHRSYIVEVEATNESDAKGIAEFFLGDPQDKSVEREREQFNFEIGELEMVNNDGTETL